jgi:hypothetical protein
MMWRRHAPVFLVATVFASIGTPQNAMQNPSDAPQQPIPFSHKAHAGTLKLPCKMCHPSPGQGEQMTIAAPATCMQCHAVVKTDSPATQKLSAFAKNGTEIRWARVYQIPDYVKFSHRKHLEAKSTCAKCHGAIEERDRLYREGDLSMAACMDCHRTKKASIDCAFCHELQQ